ncbi:hypothetical protein RRG08_029706 [Elysia crispata]|uniref:Uncharacterized protein n=1 Tax=Elysia crispata TaxID=231223 RepID=A0AAE1A2Q7_9GAST|nr:hypothetical protein RRG08_029706 [Elysia crispata]
MTADYHENLQRHGTVHVYQKDWTALDFKSAVTQHTKTVQSFRILEAKVLEIMDDRLLYNGEGCEHSVLKKGKKWASFRPAVLPPTSTVTEAKRKDVLNLLSVISAPIDVQEYYESALLIGEAPGSQDDEDDL